MQGDRERADLAGTLLAVRAARRRTFPPDLFDEAAWDMLLHLFVLLSDNETVSEAALLARIDDPAVVGVRWLRHLVANGQVRCREDGDDVAMTPAAIGNMRAFLDLAATIQAPDVSAPQG